MKVVEGTVYILTLPNGFFGRSEYGWKSIKTEVLNSELQRCGVKSELLSFEGALKKDFGANDFVMVASLEDEYVNRYIKEYLFFLSKRVRILPKYDYVLAYENKGVQELIKQTVGFGNLGGGYFFQRSQLWDEYPYVFKHISGAGSSGVSLVRSPADRRRLERRNFRVTFVRRLILAAKRFLLSPSDYAMYRYRHQGFGLVALQRFVAGLDSDFKVLVFAGKYYVLKRHNRKNDFRASGSGNFEFVEADPRVLAFSKSIYEVLGVPYASLDVACNAEGVFLIEFQCINFGPYTLNASPGYYEDSGQGWRFVEGKSFLELEMARAVAAFVRIQE